MTQGSLDLGATICTTTTVGMGDLVEAQRYTFDPSRSCMKELGVVKAVLFDLLNAAIEFVWI